MQLMVKYIPKNKNYEMKFYEILQNAILGNSYIPLWNKTPDTVFLISLNTGICSEVKTVVSGCQLCYLKEKNNTEFTHAVQHNNTMWTCISQRNVIVSENYILQNFMENITNFCF